MRHWREDEFEQKLTPADYRAGLKAWAFFAKRPRLYHLAARMAITPPRRARTRPRSLRWLPLASGWTRHRDLPAPQGRTFQQLWAERERGCRDEPRRHFARIRAGLGARPATDEGRRAAVERRLAAHAGQPRAAARDDPARGPRRSARRLPARTGRNRARCRGSRRDPVGDCRLPARVPTCRPGSGTVPIRSSRPCPGTPRPDWSGSGGAAAGDDEVGLSRAMAAASETGTLVLASGPDNPVTLATCPRRTSWSWPRPTSPPPTRTRSPPCGRLGARDAAHLELHLGTFAHGRHRRQARGRRPRPAAAVRDHREDGIRERSSGLGTSGPEGLSP